MKKIVLILVLCLSLINFGNFINRDESFADSLDIKVGGSDNTNDSLFRYKEKNYKERIFKGDNSAIYDLAELYYDNGYYEDSLKIYKDIILKSGDKSVYLEIGMCYHDLLKYDDAEKYYKLSMSKYPEASTYNLGILYYDLDKFELAEKYFKISAEKYRDSGAVNYLGLVYQGQKKYKKAEEMFLLAIEINDPYAEENLRLMKKEIENNE